MSVLPFVPAQAGTNEIAYGDIMINAAEYRAMASEHHRLAGMCRSPESREHHFRLEKDFLALAASEEFLHGRRAAQHPSERNQICTEVRHPSCGAPSAAPIHN